MQTVEFVVVGAGMAGTATARSLARSGREVVLLEQFEMGNNRGSSHGSSRIFRYSYADESFVRMAMAARPLWDELEEECGERLLVGTGGLDAGADLEAHVRALSACGAAHELLDPAARKRRWPALSIPEERPVLFQPDAGISLADKTLRALAGSATASGAELREGCRVLGLAVEGGRAVVTTDGESFRARVAVVTAGAWARGLLAEVGIDLPVVSTRETVAYFAMDDELSIPVVVDWEQPAFFGLPAPGLGIKAGLHHAGPVTDPDEPGATDDGTVARIAAWVARRYPNAGVEPVAAETCLYTNTADESFVFARHGPIVVGSACSGHGFKFAPLTGRRLAELALA